MIVRPSDDEALVLDRCLNSAYQHVDKIFITQAGPAQNKRVSEVCEAYGAVESFYKWNDSFADARNFNFAQVPKEYDYILWLDADDVLRGGEHIKSILYENPRVDVFTMWYLYGFDEWKNPIVVHHKTRIVKNDGCVKWVGDIHEDFTDNRVVERKHTNDVEVLHLTNVDRIEHSKVRNAHVAKVHAKHYPGDPRSFWVLANAEKALGNNEKALKHFQKFIKESQSDEERYIAYLRIGECEMARDGKLAAVDAYRYAIGMRPFYPDAYIQLGYLFYTMERFEEAIGLLKHAITLKPPLYTIMVFNPRDYDYTPLKWLGYCYMAINQPMLALDCFEALLKITPKDKKLQSVVENMRVVARKNEEMLRRYSEMKDMPKDKMKEALDAIPDDWKANPLFTNLRNVNFIKETSSGKDLVIVCGYTSREWTPKAVEEGIGGSEEAVIHLAKRFVKAGWHVTVYNNCGHKTEKFDGVTYAPFWTWNYRDKQDVTILWRHPRMADYEINSTKVFLDLHDVVKDGEFTEKRLSRINKVFVKSEFHRSLFPSIPDEKVAIIPNGIEYIEFAGEVTKDPLLLINTSSPDRSLSTLLRLFAKVKERVPGAKLEWAYGWDVFDVVHGNNPTVMEWKAKMIAEMERLGVVNRGRVSHRDVANMYKRARIFAYPTEFAEIDCISARKAQAAGAVPVTTDFAALNETVQYGVKVHSTKTKDNWALPYQFDYGLANPTAEQKWVDAVVELLTSPVTPWNPMREWTEQFDWEHIAERWLSIINTQ